MLLKRAARGATNMGITLTERLRTIADMVDNGSRLADIGTDHGFVPIYLLTLGKIPYAVASDVHIGPLDKARENTLKYGVGEKMRLCRADGMDGLRQGEVDTVVIAGMGGELICRILERVPQSVKTLVLQPMTDLEDVRKKVHKIGFTLVQEKIAREENKFYIVMKARRGACPYWSEQDYLISPLLLRDVQFGAYMDLKLSQVAHALEQLDGSGRDEVIKHFETIKTCYEERREQWKQCRM